MIILSRPSNTCFVGTVGDLVMQSDLPVTVRAQAYDWDGELVADLPAESYDVSPEGTITVVLREWVKYLFPQKYPLKDIASGAVHNSNLLNVHIIINEGADNQDFAFNLLNGQIGSLEDATIIERAFVNVCPQVKHTTIDALETLNLYNVPDQSVLKARLYFQDSDIPEIVDIATLDGDSLITVTLDFQALLAEYPAGRPLSGVDIYIDTIEDYAPQRYIFEQPGANDDTFYFVNMLGGLECIRFCGEKRDKRAYLSRLATFYDCTTDYGNTRSAVFSKNTGYLATELDKEFARDFLRSPSRWHYTDGKLRRIAITSGEFEAINLTLSDYTFDYRYEPDDEMRMVRVSAELPEDIDNEGVVIDPELYKLMLQLKQLRRDFDEHGELNEIQVAHLQEQINTLFNTNATINDNTPSPLKVYSSQKVEQIKQQIANLFPFRAQGRDVRISDLIAATANSSTFRQVFPFVAWMGKLSCSGTAPTTLGLRVGYGPIAATYPSQTDNNRRFTVTLPGIATNAFTVLATENIGDVITPTNCVKIIRSNSFDVQLSNNSIGVTLIVLAFLDPRPY